jgi:Protein-tyrosine-phosphatase
MQLFVVCAGDSCRSQLAEGFFMSRFPDFEVFSAGTLPESNVNPYAVKVMQEKGIDISSHFP